MNGYIFDIRAAFPVNFNREFHKFQFGQATEQYLPLGIWQFYPSWYAYSDGQIIIDKTMFLGKISGCDYNKYFTNVINNSACK